MAEALNTIQDQVQEHAAESRFNGYIALFVAVALAGITVLTRKRWLFGVASLFAGLGIPFGLAGFLHWKLHWEFMAKVLG